MDGEGMGEQAGVNLDLLQLIVAQKELELERPKLVISGT